MSPRCGFLCLSPSNLVCTPHPQPGGLQSSGSSPPRPPRVPRGAGRPPSPSQPREKGFPGPSRVVSREQHGGCFHPEMGRVLRSPFPVSVSPGSVNGIHP